MSTLNTEEIKPIKIFGWVLIVLTIIGLYFDGNFLLDRESPIYIFGQEPPSRPLIYFILVATIFPFLTGIGVVRLTKWGYILFKIFLYTAIVAFPIGTVVSFFTLSYIKKHQIKQYFGF